MCNTPLCEKTNSLVPSLRYLAAIFLRSQPPVSMRWRSWRWVRTWPLTWSRMGLSAVDLSALT